MAKINGADPITTYKSWDDPPSTARRFDFWSRKIPWDFLFFQGFPRPKRNHQNLRSHEYIDTYLATWRYFAIRRFESLRFCFFLFAFHQILKLLFFLPLQSSSLNQLIGVSLGSSLGFFTLPIPPTTKKMKMFMTQVSRFTKKRISDPDMPRNRDKLTQVLVERRHRNRGVERELPDSERVKGWEGNQVVTF